MLGYVLADKAELKIREFEIYRSYYCGICKSIADRYGQLPRLTLSYDFAFLALLIASLSSEKEELCFEKCLIHPIKKIAITRKNKYIDYAADVMILLVYYNFLDDIADEHRLRGVFGSKLFSRKAKRLKKQYPSLAEVIESSLEELSALESQKSNSLDKTGDAFSKIMSELFAGEAASDLLEGCFDAEKLSQTLRVLSHIGHNLGRWIYLADALDDLEADIKTKSYNPLIYRYEYDLVAEAPEQFKTRIISELDIVLLSCLKEIADAFSLLDIKKNKGIIDNIIYLGLLKKTEILQKRGEETNEKSL